MNYELLYTLYGNETKLPFFVESIQEYIGNKHIDKKEGIAFYQIIYSTKGEAVVYIENKKHFLKKSAGVFIPKFTPYKFYATSDEHHIYIITFLGYGVKDLLDKLELSSVRIDSLLETNKLDMIFNKIYTSIKNDRLYGNYYASTYLYEFLIEYYRVIKKMISIDENKASCPILPVLDYIDKNFRQNIKLENLCKVLDKSPQHLCRLFKKYLQVRPNEYIARKRISEAKRLLIHTDKKIGQIAKEVGFSSTDYFNSVFKKFENLLPSQFRINNKANFKNF